MKIKFHWKTLDFISIAQNDEYFDWGDPREQRDCLRLTLHPKTPEQKTFQGQILWTDEPKAHVEAYRVAQIARVSVSDSLFQSPTQSAS